MITSLIKGNFFFSTCREGDVEESDASLHLKNILGEDYRSFFNPLILPGQETKEAVTDEDDETAGILEVEEPVMRNVLVDPARSRLGDSEEDGGVVRMDNVMLEPLNAGTKLSTLVGGQKIGFNKEEDV